MAAEGIVAGPSDYSRPAIECSRIKKHTGRHFLQIPGPTNVPDRVLRAIDQPTIDHRGPAFAQTEPGSPWNICVRSVRPRAPVIVFPRLPAPGRCEAALVNTLSPGDRVLINETGWFSHIAWRTVAERLGLKVDYVPGDWRRGALASREVEPRLREDAAHAIKAVVV